jgi:homoserine O-acetyltransferase
MYVEKKIFYVPAFEFQAGRTLPVTAGYETYGELNPDRSNAILICHYFSGTSHAGGEGYEVKDAEGNVTHVQEPGWWAPLVGPGRPFDTERYFIICMDVISNVNAKHPRVVTTGPSTVDPAIGEPYGLRFPQVTIRDFVRLQKMLLDTLGIERLACVAGPSMGGMQALVWAVDYPDAVDRVIAVVSTGRISTYASVIPMQIGIDAILADPERGIHTAIKTMTIEAYSQKYTERIWPYEIGEPSPHGEAQPFSFHDQLNAIVDKRVSAVDPYHWVYISRVCQLYTLETGYPSYDEALLRIKAKVLAIPSKSDLIFLPSESQNLIDRLQRLGKTAYYREWQAEDGHLEAITHCEGYSDWIREFLEDRMSEYPTQEANRF